ncbi:hypothetical protein [Coralliovum pocilloporae]|uniref:hypothetical protein n=1 Tax=Coralliovum pocilloporae TaxID=3066369 RepID=UPI003307C1F6
MTSILKTSRAALDRIKTWGNASEPVSFVEVKELYDNAYAAIDDLNKHSVLIRKADRLKQRYINQLQDNHQRLAGAL